MQYVVTKASRPSWWGLQDQDIYSNAEHEGQVMRNLREKIYQELGYKPFILYSRKVSAMFCLSSKQMSETH